MTHLIWYGFTTLMSVAVAQDFDDLDSDSKKSKKNREVTFDSNVREIYRGWYSKSGAGAGLYIGAFSGALKPGRNPRVTCLFVINSRAMANWLSSTDS